MSNKNFVGVKQNMEKILIVDDDPYIIKLITKQLQAAGYNVFFTQKSAEAKSLATTNNIDLIISDWVMPEMTGLELCEEIKSDPNTKPIYFIIVTSREMNEDKVTAIDAGADDYLVKPFDERELLSRVRAGLRLTRLQRETVELQHKVALIELAATVGHEINNPLTALIGYLELSLKLIESKKDAFAAADIEKLKQMLQKCETQSTRIAEITAKLSTLKNPKLKTYFNAIQMIDVSPEKPPPAK
jgi:DNA-binding response OmpR family regulator